MASATIKSAVSTILLATALASSANAIPSTPRLRALNTQSTTATDAPDRFLTIFNKCGSKAPVVYSSVHVLPGADKFKAEAVPDQCLDGKLCDLYKVTDGIMNFRVAPHAFQGVEQNWGAATLAEINFNKDGSNEPWWDISRVQGWNAGVKIQYFPKASTTACGHSPVCADANCADAYWLCDTAWRNVFSPQYSCSGNAPNGGHFEITFCPDDANTEVPSSIAHPGAVLTNPREVGSADMDKALRCSCNSNITPPGSMVPSDYVDLSGSMCGPIA